MRVMFGLDATDFDKALALEDYMTSCGISWVSRIGMTQGKMCGLWIINENDWRMVKSLAMPNDVHWQKITSCNKQYVTQYDNQGRTEYLGSVHSISEDEAMDCLVYILDPFSGEFWTFKEGNPNVPLPARRVPKIVRDEQENMAYTLRSIMNATPWPVDPRCPEPKEPRTFEGPAARWPFGPGLEESRDFETDRDWPDHPERG